MTEYYWQVRTTSGRLLWDGESEQDARRIARTSEYGPCRLIRETWPTSDDGKTWSEIVAAVTYVEMTEDWCDEHDGPAAACGFVEWPA